MASGARPRSRVALLRRGCLEETAMLTPLAVLALLVTLAIGTSALAVAPLPVTADAPNEISGSGPPG